MRCVCTLYALTKMFMVLKMHFSERGELCSYSGGSDQLTNRTEGAKTINRCSTLCGTRFAGLLLIAFHDQRVVP